MKGHRRRIGALVFAVAAGVIGGQGTSGGAASPCCTQDKGIFELPKLDFAKVEPPDACKSALDRAMAILPEVEAALSEALKTAFRQAVADREADETEAEAWDSAATLALLEKRPAAALWAELNALKIEWDLHFVVQAGIYLSMLDKSDDAKLLLHCAYSAGSRSPYLLEALANIYRRAGDKSSATRYIREASAEAPDDVPIQVQKSIIETGKPPAPPSPTADAVDTALEELKAHIRHVMAGFKRSERLRSRVQDVYYGESEGPDAGIADRQKGYDGTIESLKKLAVDAKMTPAQFSQRMPGTPPAEARIVFRNMFFNSAIIAYLSLTENLLSQSRPPEVAGLDVGFWSGPMGLDPVQYARMIKDRSHFKFEAEEIKCGGSQWDEWWGTYFLAYYHHAAVKQREGHGKCGEMHRGNLSAEEACRLEVDRKYCVTVRSLHNQWSNVTEALLKKLALRFDNAASALLARASSEVAGAYEFAAKYAKEMSVKPGNAAGSAWFQSMNQQAQGWVKDLNKTYTSLVDMTVRSGSGGTAEKVEYHAETYRLGKEDAQSTIDGYKSIIEERCEPIDRRVFQQLVEEQRRAVSQMLWEKLVRDLNAKWDPNASCTLGLGKWFHASIDIEGRKSFGGKWAIAKKAFDQGETVEVGVNYKTNWTKEGDFNGASVSLDTSGKAGYATGKAGITVGTQWNPKTNSWDFPCEVGGTAGLGYKSKNNIGFT